MQKSTVITISILIVILLLGGLFTWYTQYSQEKTQRALNRATELTTPEVAGYTYLDGTPFSFEAFEGKYLVVNSWATWCPFCRKELQDFERIAKEFIEEDVVVVAINRKEAIPRVQSFLKTLGTFDALHIVLDPTDTYYASMGGFSMPETLFYDKNGKAVFHKRGVLTIEEMREKIMKMKEAMEK